MLNLKNSEYLTPQNVSTLQYSELCDFVTVLEECVALSFIFIDEHTTDHIRKLTDRQR